jgi:hypothetical protein
MAVTHHTKWKKMLRSVLEQAKEQKGWTSNKAAAEALGIHRVTLQSSLSTSNYDVQLGLGIVFQIIQHASLDQDESAKVIREWMRTQKRNSCAKILGGYLEEMIKSGKDGEIEILLKTIRKTFR